MTTYTRTCDLEVGDVVKYDDWPEATVVKARPLGGTRYSTWRVELSFDSDYEQKYFMFGPCETWARPYGD